MHDRFLDSTLSSEQETKVDDKLVKPERLSPLSTLDGSAGTSAQIRCECLDELAAYTAAPVVASEPNSCGRSLVWSDASARRGQIEEAFAASDLGRRAELVQKYGIMATCTCSRVLIESVANTSMTGILVQSYLEGPFQASPGILGKLVQKNQRKYEAAQMLKPKHVPVPRGPSLLAIVSGLRSVAGIEKA